MLKLLRFNLDDRKIDLVLDGVDHEERAKKRSKRSTSQSDKPSGSKPKGKAGGAGKAKG